MEGKKELTQEEYEAIKDRVEELHLKGNNMSPLEYEELNGKLAIMASVESDVALIRSNITNEVTHRDIRFSTLIKHINNK